MRPTAPPHGPKGQCDWCGAALTGKRGRCCSGHWTRWWEFWYSELPGYVIVVFARDGFRCVLCGQEASWVVADSRKDKWRQVRHQLHIDHIQPVSKGGQHVLSNMRTLCRRCNIGRSNRDETWEPVAVRRERAKLATWNAASRHCGGG